MSLSSRRITHNSKSITLFLINIHRDTSPDYEPFSPALSSPGPSISERGGKNSPARSVVSIPATVPAAASKFVTTEQPAIVVTTAPIQQKYLQQQIITPKKAETFSAVQQTAVASKKTVQPKKELKIYKMAPMMMTNSANAVVPNKKVTIQVKNSQTKIQPHISAAGGNNGGTFVINKNNSHFSGELFHIFLLLIFLPKLTGIVTKITL